MDTTKTSEQIDQPRRDFVGAAAMTIAAAGASSLLATKAGAITEDKAIRPSKHENALPMMRKSTRGISSRTFRYGRCWRRCAVLRPCSGDQRIIGSARLAPEITLSLKRSTQNLQLSTSWLADYPIFSR